MSAPLRRLEGVVCQIDDILVFGKNQQKHDENLKPVLKLLAQADLTLSLLVFSKDSPLSRAHCRWTQSTTWSGRIREPKFSPNLADTTKPLQDMLNKKRQWVWEEPQRWVFEEIKNALCSSPVLALINPNPNRETEISAGASSFELGAVMGQKQPNQEWQPVAYIPQAMTPTEQRYAQIERGLGSHLGLWALFRLSHRSYLPNQDRPQAPHTSLQLETSQWTSSVNPTVPIEDDTVWFQYHTHTRKGSQYTLQSPFRLLPTIICGKMKKCKCISMPCTVVYLPLRNALNRSKSSNERMRYVHNS